MDQLQIKYRELFSVSIEQLFYQNKISKVLNGVPSADFVLLPTVETMALMKQMDLVAKNNVFKGGLSVFAHVLGQNAGGDDLLRFPVRQGSKLVFMMLLQNADLLNFNDLPDLTSDSVFYFNNLITDPAPPRNKLHLSKDVSGVKPVDVIKKTSAQYYFHHSSPVVAGTAKVKHLFTGKLVAPQSIVNQSGQSDLAFDLSNLPSGECELQINNTKEDGFYYLADARPSVFGVVEFSLSPTLDANYRIVETDNSIPSQAAQYKIRFVNRQTLWRYNVHLPAESPLFVELLSLSAADRADFVNQMSLATNDSSLTFSKIAASESDFVFVSDRLVATQEKYFSASATLVPLNLTLEKHVSGHLRPTSLPYPSNGSVNASNPATVYSDIFITL